MIPKKTPKGTTKGWSGYLIPSYNPGSYHNWWYDDPFHIPDFTTRLLSNLQHAKPSTPTPQKFQAGMDSLPQELRDKITSLLLVGAIGLDCTYLLSQSCWRRLCLRIPFLWDLDENIISGFKDEEDKQWDWERLFRQVMARIKPPTQPEEGDTRAWTYHEVGLDVPPGFINRRRIWQLLEDMDPRELEFEAMRDPDSVIYDSDLQELRSYSDLGCLATGEDDRSWEANLGSESDWGSPSEFPSWQVPTDHVW
ncbi:hypothetical protein QQX98_002838 [Neonectria punicea]|uniref:F-box domain-containing protein n=1 Tax=Neonectria punicea TaxID=979145 RepID=A0ABR1HH00_9HYPO